MQCTAGLEPAALAALTAASAAAADVAAGDPPQHARALLAADEGETLEALLTTFLSAHAILWLQHTRVMDVTHLRTLRVLQTAKLALAPELAALLRPPREHQHQYEHDHRQQRQQQRGSGGGDDGGGGDGNDDNQEGSGPVGMVPVMCFVCTAPRGSDATRNDGGRGGDAAGAAAAAVAATTDGNVRMLLRKSRAYLADVGKEPRPDSLFRPPPPALGAVCLAIPPPHTLLPAFTFAFRDLSVTGGGGWNSGGSGGAEGGGEGGAGEEDGGGRSEGGGMSGDILAELRKIVKGVEWEFVNPVGAAFNARAQSPPASAVFNPRAQSPPAWEAWAATTDALASALSGGDDGRGGDREGGGSSEADEAVAVSVSDSVSTPRAAIAVAKARQWLRACTDPETQLARAANDAACTAALGLYTDRMPAAGRAYPLETHAQMRAAALTAFWTAARGPSAGTAAAALCASCEQHWNTRTSSAAAAAAFAAAAQSGGE